MSHQKLDKQQGRRTSEGERLSKKKEKEGGRYVDQEQEREKNKSVSKKNSLSGCVLSAWRLPPFVYDVRLTAAVMIWHWCDWEFGCVSEWVRDCVRMRLRWLDCCKCVFALQCWNKRLFDVRCVCNFVLGFSRSKESQAYTQRESERASEREWAKELMFVVTSSP